MADLSLLVVLLFLASPRSPSRVRTFPRCGMQLCRRARTDHWLAAQELEIRAVDETLLTAPHQAHSGGARWCREPEVPIEVVLRTARRKCQNPDSG
eukprot:scaffold731_cov261-Pinguiococcus_pyrenoidosus.AAC.6